MALTLAVLTACAGFLLAVLWMDLIFDAQVLSHRHAGDELPESVLASIAGYYHRATARPMSTLIAAVMGVLLTALAVRATFGHEPGWLVAVSACVGRRCGCVGVDSHGAPRGPAGTARRQFGAADASGAGDLSRSRAVLRHDAGVSRLGLAAVSLGL